MLQPLLSPRDLSVFSGSYRDAVTAFRIAAQGLPQAVQLRSLPYGGVAPDQSGLSTEYLYLGSAQAERVLVLQSAVHGVEGYCGSAIQVDLLQRLGRGELVLPDGLALVMLHAVNPWGFAWDRRVDEQGIDVNRNFVDFSAPLPDNAGYRHLANAMVPKDGNLAMGDQILGAFLQQHGQREYELAASGGQYEFNDGLFFGGRGPSQARLNLETVIRELDCPSRRVVVLDLHTGLGPYGHGELICDHPLDSEGTDAARRWFGDAVTLPEAGDSCSVPKHGLVDYAWHQVMGAGSCYLTLEFGTYPLSELLRCLREDHVVRKPGAVQRQDAEAERVRQQLVHQFYPAESQWQTLVLLRARQVIQLACRGLLLDE